MRIYGFLLYSLLLASGLEAQSTCLNSDWQTIEIGSLGGVEFRLRVLKEATLADFEWLGFEIENVGQESLGQVSAFLRIRAERFDLATGKLISSGELMMIDVESEDLPSAAITRQFREPSNQVSVRLAPLTSSPVREFDVRATVHLDAKVSGYGKFRTPAQGIPFRFRWREPKADDIEPLRHRLRELFFHGSIETPTDRYIVSRYLAIPEVASIISAGEFITRLKNRQIERSTNARHFFSTYPEEAIAYYLEQLGRGNRKVLSELFTNQEIWDERFVPPLVLLHQENPFGGRNLAPIRVLSRHNDAWVDNPLLRKTLANRLLAAAAELPAPSSNSTMGELRAWVDLMYLLPFTQEPDVVPYLRSLLGSRAQLVDPESLAYSSAYYVNPVASRLGDFAYDAILRILWQTDPLFVMRLPVRTTDRDYRPRFDHLAEDVRTTLRLRDQMIADLLVLFADRDERLGFH